jgi:hypothetical protein
MRFFFKFSQGERFDFIVNANQVAKPYWIRAKGFADCSVNSVFETAILLYENGLNINQAPLQQLFYTNMSRLGLVRAKILFLTTQKQYTMNFHSIFLALIFLCYVILLTLDFKRILLFKAIESLECSSKCFQSK